MLTLFISVTSAEHNKHPASYRATAIRRRLEPFDLHQSMLTCTQSRRYSVISQVSSLEVSCLHASIIPRAVIPEEDCLNADITMETELLSVK